MGVEGEEKEGISRDSEGDGGGQAPGDLRREVMVVFAISVVATGLLAVGSATLPWMAPYVSLLVALVFLGLPTWWVSRRRGEEPESAGMRYGAVPRGLLWGVGCAAVVFVPFALGFHVWSTEVQGREASWSWDNYARWPAEIEGRPAGLEQRSPGIYVWSEGDWLRVWWIGESGVEVALSETRGDMEAVKLDAVLASGEDARVFSGVGVNGGVALASTSGAGSVVLDVRVGGASVAPERVVMGAGGVVAQEVPLSLEESWSWLWMVLLTQVLFVGLPEEYFYRGYMQPTLDRVYGEDAGWGRGWWRLRCSVVVTSALFALGHVLVDPNPARLAVFFPSLLFGLLRIRTDGIVAPLVFHALCNTMVEVLVVHYRG